MRLTKYEKETIILTSEGDHTYEIYTFNKALQRKLIQFARKYPDQCYLKEERLEGSKTFVVEKKRVSIRLMAPCSEERKRIARNNLPGNAKVNQEKK